MLNPEKQYSKMMIKYISFTIIALLISCNPDQVVTQADQKAFEEMAQAWHKTYTKGGANLNEILSGLDENIDMWENGKVWTYDELVKFGEHLPVKAVVDTYNDQKLLKKHMGYDYVSQTYISSISGDTMRETSSRLWELKEDGWKIVRMNNLIKRESK